MVEILKNALKQLINDLDSGNTNIDEEEQKEVIDFIHKLTSQEMSKVQAYQYLDISRATFNNYISKGILPEGKKKAGFNEKIWYKYDLDNYKNRKNKK